MNLKNTLFFNIDTQRDFMDKDGALYVQHAEDIKLQLQLLTQIADAHNIKVINTADFHTDTSKEISDAPDYIKTFPKHCLVDSEGCDFIEETNPKKIYEDNYYIVHYNDSKIDQKQFNRARNIIILKDQFDVFAGNKLIEDVLMLVQLKEAIEKVIVYGVATSICVKFAIEGLLKRRFKVYLVLDAIKDLPGIATDALYSYWLDQGVILTTTKQIRD